MKRDLVSDEEVLRLIEEDLKDQELVDRITAVMTLAKARGVPLDRLEGVVLEGYRPQTVATS